MTSEMSNIYNIYNILMYSVYLKYQKLKRCVEVVFQWNYSLNLFPQWCEAFITLTYYIESKCKTGILRTKTSTKYL